LLNSDIWNGQGADANWTTAANWVGNVAPQAGDDLSFGAAGALQKATTFNNFSPGTAFKSITFTDSGYTLNGNALTLQSSITSNVANTSNNVALGIVAGANSSVSVSGAGTRLTLSGTLTGGSPNVVQVVRAGNNDGSELDLAFSSNTFAGSLQVSGGKVVATTSTALSSAGRTTLLGGPLTLEGGLVFGGHISFSGGNGDLVGAVGESNTFAGVLDPADGGLVSVSGAGTRLTLSGTLTGGSPNVVQVVRAGNNDGSELDLAFSSNTFAGSLQVSGGKVVATTSTALSSAGRTTVFGESSTLLVNSSLPSSPVRVIFGTLGGTGTIGPVDVDPGQVSPGVSGVGTLGTGNISFTNQSSFKSSYVVHIEGNNSSKLNVSGTVNLGGATLSVSLDPANLPHAPLVIIANNGGSAVAGTFADLPQGARFSVGTLLFMIDYNGGNGNDVVLTPIIPTVTPPANQTAVEGASSSIALGSFTDPGGGPWTVDVNWNDGTQDTMFPQMSTGTIPPKSHTFGEEASYTVTVKVTDTTDGQFDSKTFTVTVSDPAVVHGPPVAVTAVEGAAFTGETTATFTDPGGAEALSNYSATINWGDSPTNFTATITGGTPLGSTSAVFTVSGNHTYAEEGTYTVTTTINHSGVITVVTSTATVSDPAVIGTSVPVSGKEAIAFTLPVATFTDSGGAELLPSIDAEYRATIDWGDSSSSAGTISYSDGAGSKTAPFTVAGTHTFAEEGTYSITVTISHDTAPNTIVDTTATVRDNYGLLVLDPTDPQSLMITGNGAVVVNHSGAVVVDSSDPAAIFLAGDGNATLAAAETDVTGDLERHGHPTFLGELNHEAATPDPIGLPLPPMPAIVSAAPLYISSGTVTLSPGTYVGGIQIDGTAVVTLSGGVYYMKGGGFEVSGQATVTSAAAGPGVLLVNAPVLDTDVIRITGQAVVTLTADNSLPEGFAPYDGIAVLQDPASDNTVLISGQASLTVTGTTYAAEALLQVTGNGNMTVSAFPPPFSTVGGVVVVFQAKVDGNGDLTINADPPPGGAGGLINYPGRTLRAEGAGLGSPGAAVAATGSPATGARITAVPLVNGPDIARLPAAVALSGPAALSWTTASGLVYQLPPADAPLAAAATAPGPDYGAGVAPAAPSAQLPALDLEPFGWLLPPGWDACLAAGVGAPIATTTADDGGDGPLSPVAVADLALGLQGE
jgi:hypothetical protein